MRLTSLLALFPVASRVRVDGNTCTHLQDDGTSSTRTVVLDQFYVVNTVLVITGLQDVNIELSGVVQYTPKFAYWSPNSYYMEFQNATTFWFLSGHNLHLCGGGTLDANGQVWWDYPNKTVGIAGGSSTAFARPVSLTMGNASNVLIEDLTEIGSPLWINFVYQSTNVIYRRMNISSTSYSSNRAVNSDGWDIYRSSYVTVKDSTIHSDDDCVSFKPNTTNIVIRNLYCNGSHGISVGSLGQYAGETDIVANIYVKNISMNNAQNGARIKVFGGSPYPNSTAGGGTGYVQNVTFEDFYVNNVDDPIHLDQCYDTAAHVYINVTGMSSGNSGNVVVELECSAECYGITATGTNLTSPDGPAVYYCQNVANETALDFSCTTPPSSSS
ncbi:glycoside hydrolase family 28 protein [Imleria badia]|nr:glycoside hydrolase family 28 protein [Imleria badia]